MLPSFKDVFFMSPLKEEKDIEEEGESRDKNIVRKYNLDLTSKDCDDRRTGVKRPFSKTKTWEKVKVLKVPEISNGIFGLETNEFDLMHETVDEVDNSRIHNKRARKFYEDSFPLSTTWRHPFEYQHMHPKSNVFSSGNLVFVKEKHSFVVKEKEMRAFFRLLGKTKLFFTACHVLTINLVSCDLFCQ